MSGPIQFSIIGGAGYRAQYYLRIAKSLPEHFRVSGIVVRDSDKGRAMERKWGLVSYRSLDELLQHEHPDFIVVCVDPKAGYHYLLQLSELGIPALTETPPASDLQSLHHLYEQTSHKNAKIQVAEQYPFHPYHAARRHLLETGILGTITETTVSISHYYHAVSLMRKMLGVRFEDVEIQAMRFHSSWLAGPNRQGPAREEKRIPLERDLAWLRFDGKLGVYDFTKDQHRSWIRSNHICIRGERGEIRDQRILLQPNVNTPIQLDLKRINRGEAENQEGYFLQGIQAGSDFVYTNPFAPARLYDDELAIATCLHLMANYVKGGPSFYDLAEASQDHYIGMLIQEAIQTGETITSERQIWAE